MAPKGMPASQSHRALGSKLGARRAGARGRGRGAGVEDDRSSVLRPSPEPPQRRTLLKRIRAEVSSCAVPSQRGELASAPRAVIRRTQSDPAAELACSKQHSRERALLRELSVDGFQAFESKVLSFARDPAAGNAALSACDSSSAGAALRSHCVIVGPNASGKSSLLDALRFVLARELPLDLGSYVRRGFSQATVKASFDGRGDCRFTLRREVRIPGDALQAECSYWVGEADAETEVPAERYRSWTAEMLLWHEGDLILPQFSLLGPLCAERILERLPEILHRSCGGGSSAAPLLKRRSASRSADDSRVSRDAHGGGQEGGHGGRSAGLLPVTAQAWVARRVDEIYQELTREPLDAEMREWGEGGQACLRCVEGGSYTLFVSQQRGAAACGFGVPLASLSEGLP
eukprot:TRINITY_DN17031_c0_g1_i2.p1 TRINITY_DN17031_c0_g1~~TRINITY_DN17031_c0_g1_i2.p1  ORF type:complete len:404 (-),score=66.14 TRINITY_DN17031_c0_g1_i2:293-1504(-)